MSHRRPEPPEFIPPQHSGPVVEGRVPTVMGDSEADRVTLYVGLPQPAPIVGGSFGNLDRAKEGFVATVFPEVATSPSHSNPRLRLIDTLEGYEEAFSDLMAAIDRVLMGKSPETKAHCRSTVAFVLSNSSTDDKTQDNMAKAMALTMLKNATEDLSEADRGQGLKSFQRGIKIAMERVQKNRKVHQILADIYFNLDLSQNESIALFLYANSEERMLTYRAAEIFPKQGRSGLEGLHLKDLLEAISNRTRMIGLSRHQIEAMTLNELLELSLFPENDPQPYTCKDVGDFPQEERDILRPLSRYDDFLAYLKLHLKPYIYEAGQHPDGDGAASLHNSRFVYLIYLAIGRFADRKRDDETVINTIDRLDWLKGQNHRILEEAARMGYSYDQIIDRLTAWKNGLNQA